MRGRYQGTEVVRDKTRGAVEVGGKEAVQCEEREKKEEVVGQAVDEMMTKEERKVWLEREKKKTRSFDFQPNTHRESTAALKCSQKVRRHQRGRGLDWFRGVGRSGTVNTRQDYQGNVDVQPRVHSRVKVSRTKEGAASIHGPGQSSMYSICVDCV